MSEEEAHMAEQERMREELDCLIVVHKHGLEGTAERLAAHLGLTKQYQQEIIERGNHAANQ